MSRIVALAVTSLCYLVCHLAGCVPQKQHDQILLRNRELAELLVEKEVMLAGLEARLDALQARAADIERSVAESKEHAAALARERDAVRGAFEKLVVVYKALSGAEPLVSGVGISNEEAVMIRAVADKHPGLLDFDLVTGRLRFNADLTFEFGSVTVKPEAKEALQELGAILTSAAGESLGIIIIGHTDNEPTARPETLTLLKILGKRPDNWGLSEAQAEAMAEILKKVKVATGRIEIKGFGPSQPIASNQSTAGKAQNRRVEIFLFRRGTSSTGPRFAPLGKE